MKILFIYHHRYEEYWKDGLWAALERISKEHTVDKVNLFNQDIQDYSGYDFILGWGAFGSPADKKMRTIEGVKKGLCIAGNVVQPIDPDKYDVLFYETKWYRPQIQFHKNIVRAFGINSKIFYQTNMSSNRPIDVLSVGSFSLWKRFDLLSKNKSKTRLVVGEIQDDNPNESLEIIFHLLPMGCGVMDMTSPEQLAKLYNSSKTMHMPSTVYGGGERAVLEARACGCEVIVEDDNPKLQELLTSKIYNEEFYADRLLEGITSCL